jgi:hypothetical protein
MTIKTMATTEAQACIRALEGLVIQALRAEPDEALKVPDDTIALMSLAISMRRIADAVERWEARTS